MVIFGTSLHLSPHGIAVLCFPCSPTPDVDTYSNPVSSSSISQSDVHSPDRGNPQSIFYHPLPITNYLFVVGSSLSWFVFLHYFTIHYSFTWERCLNAPRISLLFYRQNSRKIGKNPCRTIFRIKLSAGKLGSFHRIIFWKLPGGKCEEFIGW